MSKDAWKDTGWCGECRRYPYCKTQCRACRVRLTRLREVLKEYLHKKHEQVEPTQTKEDGGE